MLIEVKQGLDVLLAGAPEQAIFPGRAVTRVAVLGLEHVDLRASLRVAEGDAVTMGQTLFVDRAEPRVRFVAPAAGRVVEIHRAARRRLQAVVLALDEDAPDIAEAEAKVSSGPIATLARQAICTALCEAGLWPALRARPYGHIAPVDGVPGALFVTAIDTQPGAADPRVVIAARSDDFRSGLEVLARLAPRTWLCTAPGAELPCPDCEGLQAVAFAGPHPAGLVGTHVRHLHADGGTVWHVGYQDVLAIGHLFRTGTLTSERVVAVAGPGVHSPQLVRTRLGADLTELLAGEIVPSARVLGGSVLSGRDLSPASGFLGRFEQQVTVLADPPGGVRRFGFARALRALLMPTGSVDRAALRSARVDTATHGLPSGMLPVEAFDRVWPFDAPPAPLLRALLIRDTETASSLGCLALAEEDLALCAYVCPAKLDYGAALRDTLRELERGR
ncbi:MAG TPA: NADH:ubiquinone reductase (Na(+)-transporting) subunit A [Pseudomonadales bacterium]|nr:NADH:ubiquinone reductase (Na(+)-transporting) subunit A [Pseudomonadales bacterium]